MRWLQVSLTISGACLSCCHAVEPVGSIYQQNEMEYLRAWEGFHCSPWPRENHKCSDCARDPVSHSNAISETALMKRAAIQIQRCGQYHSTREKPKKHIGNTAFENVHTRDRNQTNTGQGTLLMIATYFALMTGLFVVVDSVVVIVFLFRRRRGWFSCLWWVNECPMQISNNLKLNSPLWQETHDL